jgi:hypothetical protein
MKGIYVLVDEKDYIELRKRLLEERKSVSRWVREKIREYLNKGEDRNTVDKAPSRK